jgi:hypothetical protein
MFVRVSAVVLSAAFGVLGLALAGCPGRNAVNCAGDGDCDLSSGGTCLAGTAGGAWCAYPDPGCPGGYRYSNDDGDGLGGTCVPGEPDAGVDGPPDAHDGGHDTPIDSPIDASPDTSIDAGPAVGPITSGEFAEEVIGQNDESSDIANSGGESANSLNNPQGVFTDGTYLWVADSGNARVLQWNSIPAVDRPIADVVIGQANATSSTSTTTQSAFHNGVSALAVAGGHVVISDASNNRVMIFTPVPTTTGIPATIVLGQASFTTSGTGKSASTMNGPTDVWTDGTRLAVVDNANSRVLVWTTFPTMNGQAANIVLGRSAFGLGLGDAVSDPPTSSSMKFPSGVWSNGTKLYVADGANHRVLVWNAFPTANGAAADLVIGQTGFDQNQANAGGANANALGLDEPYKAIEVDNALFISDSVNHRVVVHYPIPTTSGPMANGVLGQDNLTSTVVPNTPAANRLNDPRFITATATATGLYVADYDWHRVTRFPLTP